MSRPNAAPLIVAVSVLIAPLGVEAQLGSLRASVPSPEAASFAEYAEIPVGLYTGIPNISIPLFTAQGRTLELPIGLRYHAGGVRVEEIAGWAGLGWSLDAGGVITRTVRGLVDEGLNGYWNTGDTWYDPDNFTGQGLVDAISDIQSEALDPEPDRFHFNFMGRAGEFVMGPADTSGTQIVRTIPFQKIHISPTISGNKITSFTVLTEDGTKYTFGAAEATTDLTAPPSGLITSVSDTDYNSAWRLTEVRAPGGDNITLTYAPDTVRHEVAVYEEDYRQITGITQCTTTPTLIKTQLEIQEQRLTTITSAAHTIDFIADTVLRDDAKSWATGTPKQAKRLERIEVKTPSGVVLRRFDLSHGYFTGNRLRLDQVQERDSAGATLPPHKLTYYAGSLPAQRIADGSSFYSQDHWGFYNGYANSSLLPQVTHDGVVIPGADRRTNPDSSYALAGTLSRLTYPTGGWVDFEFEQHDYGQVQDVSGQPLGEGPLLSDSVEVLGEVIDSVLITVNTAGPVVGTITIEMSANCGTPGLIGCPFVSFSGGGSYDTAGYYLVELDSLSTNNPYVLKVIGGLAGETLSAKIEWRELESQLKTPAGGLRIESISVSGDDSTSTTQQTFVYEYPSTGVSSGIIQTVPRYLWDSSGNGTCGHLARASRSRTPLGGGPHIAYAEVLVQRGDAAIGGSTRHVFRSMDEAADTYAPANQWQYHRPTSREWKRGQLQSQIHYSDSAATVRERERFVDYLFRENQATNDTLTYHSFPALSIYTLEAGLTSTDRYDVISAWYHTDEDYYRNCTSSDCSSNGGPITTRYSYGNPAHAQVTAIQSPSQTQSHHQTFTYPHDYYADTTSTSMGAALRAMADTVVHMPGVVIEQVDERTLSTQEVFRGTVTYYDDIGSGRYAPVSVYALKADAPIPGSSFAATTDATDFAIDDAYVLVDTVLTYDSVGRPLSVEDGLGNQTDYTYGGNTKDAFLSTITTVNPSGTDLATEIHYTDGFVAWIEDAADTRQNFSWDAFGRLRTRENDADEVVEAFAYEYSAAGGSYDGTNPNSVTDSTHVDGSITTITRTYFDGLGSPIQINVEGGSEFLVRHTDLDGLRRPWRAWRPYASDTSTYDTLVVTSAAAAFDSIVCGGDTAYAYTETLYDTYDALGRVGTVHRPYCGTALDSIAYGYTNGTSTYTAITDELDHVQRTEFDKHLRETRRWEGYGGSGYDRSYTYDGIGRVLSRTSGFTVNYEWSTLDNVTKRTDTNMGTTGSGITEQRFDRLSRLRFSQDPVQAAAGVVEFITYDFAGRPRHEGEISDSLHLVFPDSVPTSAETNSSNWHTTRAYDAKPSTAGAPWSGFSTQINGVTLSNTLGRLTAVATQSNGAWQVELYSYDDEGRIADRYVYTEGSAGSAVLAALDTHIEYEYNRAGLITKRSTAVGSLDYYQWYDYDGFGRLAEVFASTSDTKPTTADVSYTYAADGQVASREFKSGPEVERAYTLRGELAAIGDTASSTIPFSAVYTYNGNGTVESAAFRNPGVPASVKQYTYSHTYDDANRMDSAGASGFTSSLAFEVEVPNYSSGSRIPQVRRRTETGSLVDDVLFSYDKATSTRPTRLIDFRSSGGATWDIGGPFSRDSIFYDANGNMTGVHGTPYSITAATYDHSNQPTSITAGGVTSDYRYGASGFRISKKEGSADEVFYIREGLVQLAAITINGTTVQDSEFKLLAGTQVVGRQPASGNPRYYHTDMLGSVRSVVDGATLLEGHDYFPFGTPMPGRTTLASSTREGFSGNEVDAATSLSYFGARYYLPLYGVFNARDPLADEFDMVSPYVYALGDPVGLTDPFGLCVPWCIGAIVGGAVGVVGAAISGESFASWETWAKIGTSAAIGGLSGGLSVLPQTAARSGFVVAGQMALGSAEAIAISAIGGDYDDIASDALQGAFLGLVGELAGNALGSLRANQIAELAQGQVEALQGAGFRIRDVNRFTGTLNELWIAANAAGRNREAALAGFSIGLIGLITDEVF